MPHLKLDQSLVDEARALHIAEPVIDFISKHTTVTIERSTLRLIGIDGIDEEEVSLPNCIVDNALSFCRSIYTTHKLLFRSMYA